MRESLGVLQTLPDESALTVQDHMPLLSMYLAGRAGHMAVTALAQ